MRSWRICCVAAVLACAALAAGARADVGSLADSSGEVVGWHGNAWGQLDVPADTYRGIAAGFQHSAGLRTDGTLAAWGSNHTGQLDAIPAGTFTAVAAGGNTSFGLRIDGTVAGWGYDASGQVSTIPAGQFRAVAAGIMHGVGLRTNGTLVAWGDNSSGQCDAVPAGEFKAVAAGGFHSLALRTDGSLVGWGDNAWGQLDTLPVAGTFARVAAGLYNGVAIRTDGTLVGLGTVSMALPSSEDYKYIDVSMSAERGLALRTDGGLASWGFGMFHSQPLTSVPEGKFVAIAAGAEHSLALVGRTQYDHLLVDGAGAMSDVASWLNRTISVAGDATIRSTLYTAGRPTMTVSGQILLESQGRLQGTDPLFAKLQGRFLGQAGSRIQAVDNALILGTDASTDGFVHNGSMTIQSGTVALYDADQAILGGQTTLSDGGALWSSHGIILTSSGTVAGDGGAALQNGLTNHGVVTGGPSGGLAMVDGRVNGEGSFLGNVWFLRTTYAPGNSAASVTLGDPEFAQGRLEMELGGLVQGSQYDHVDILGRADLYGPALDVLLIEGFSPAAGNSFDLFDGVLNGTFSSLNLPDLAPGLYWDSSTLYVDGVLRVAQAPDQVPEPATAGLFLLGTGVLAARRRRL